MNYCRKCLFFHSFFILFYIRFVYLKGISAKGRLFYFTAGNSKNDRFIISKKEKEYSKQVLLVNCKGSVF